MLGVIHQLVSREVNILQPFKQATIDNVTLDNVLDILGMNLHIGGVVGHDPDDGTLGTKAKATRCHDIHTASQSIVGYHSNEVVNDLKAA